MEELKRNVAEYIKIKEDLKVIAERKKQLEKNICNVMEQENITTLELTNGTKLNYCVKEALTFSKDKSRKKEE